MTTYWIEIDSPTPTDRIEDAARVFMFGLLCGIVLGIAAAGAVYAVCATFGWM